MSGDAIATVLALRVGSTFRLHGKTHTSWGGAGASSGADARGEYVKVPVFGPRGGKTFVTVRPAATVEVLHECAPWCREHGGLR